MHANFSRQVGPPANRKIGQKKNVFARNEAIASGYPRTAADAQIHQWLENKDILHSTKNWQVSLLASRNTEKTY